MHLFRSGRIHRNNPRKITRPLLFAFCLAAFFLYSACGSGSTNEPPKNDPPAETPASRPVESESQTAEEARTPDESLLRGKTIVFLGDSITLGYRLENRAARFSSVLCREVGATEVNLAKTGSQIAPTEWDGGESFLPRLKAYLEDGGEADFLVIFGGTNDYELGLYPPFPPEEEEEARDHRYFIYAAAELLDYCRERGLEDRTLVVTPYPHLFLGHFEGGESVFEYSLHTSDEPNYFGYTLDTYVRILIAACDEAGYPTLNLYEEGGFDWKTQTIEGCHPTTEGHQRLASLVRSALVELAGGLS